MLIGVGTVNGAATIMALAVLCCCSLLLRKTPWNDNGDGQRGILFFSYISFKHFIVNRMNQTISFYIIMGICDATSILPVNWEC